MSDDEIPFDVPEELPSGVDNYAFGAYDEYENILSGFLTPTHRDDAERIYAERITIIEQLIENLEDTSDYTTEEIFRDIVAHHNDPGTFREGSR